MCPRVVYSVTDKPLGLEYTARVCRERENASKHGSADEHLPDAGIIRHSPDEPGTAWTIADGGVPGKPWVRCAVLSAFQRYRTTSGPAIWPFFLESRRTPFVVMRLPPLQFATLGPGLVAVRRSAVRFPGTIPSAPRPRPSGR